MMWSSYVAQMVASVWLFCLCRVFFAVHASHLAHSGDLHSYVRRNHETCCQKSFHVTHCKTAYATLVYSSRIRRRVASHLADGNDHSIEPPLVVRFCIGHASGRRMFCYTNGGAVRYITIGAPGCNRCASHRLSTWYYRDKREHIHPHTSTHAENAT